MEDFPWCFRRHCCNISVLSPRGSKFTLAPQPIPYGLYHHFSRSCTRILQRHREYINRKYHTSNLHFIQKVLNKMTEIIPVQHIIVIHFTAIIFSGSDIKRAIKMLRRYSLQLISTMQFTKLTSTSGEPPRMLIK